MISIALAVTLGKNFAQVVSWWTGTQVDTVATDETIVVSMCAGVLLAFVIALINKVTRLGLLSRMAERVTFVLIPPLLLIFLVLGTIFLGIATPTEGGAMGALGAIDHGPRTRAPELLAARRRSTPPPSCPASSCSSWSASTMFSLVFQGVDGQLWVEHLLTGLPGGQLGFLIVVNLLIFVLAFFLDFFELSFIVVPLLAPVAEKLGIDLVWFGVLLGVNMQTSFMHPPFGFALFYLRSVAPKRNTRTASPEDDRAGDHDADLLGGGALRADPGHHGGPDHRLPRDRLQRPGQGRKGGPREGANPDGKRHAAPGLVPKGA